ncbi:hypothetical protein D9M71_659230 [compost metagenome]
MLEAELGLPGFGQVEILLAWAQGDQVTDTIFTGGILAIQRQFIGQRKHQPGTPVATVEAAVGVAVVDQVVTVDVVLVAANAGHQRPAFRQLGAVFGEQGKGAGGALGLWAGRAVAMEVAWRRVPRIDEVAADIVVR